MKLEDVVIEGFWLGLETVDECVGHFWYRRPPIWKWKEQDEVIEDILKQVEAYENGELELDFKKIYREVDKLNNGV
jgi:hypothetical protein